MSPPSAVRVMFIFCSVADPHYFDADADPDPAFHAHADPNPAFLVDVDPHPTCHSDADPLSI
jgi:hypothetical protein